MNKHFVKLGLVAAMGLLGAVVTTEADAKDMVGWRVEGSGANIVPGQGYSLYNLDRGGYLGWKDRTGANLELEGKANGGVVFKRKGGDGPLKCGEVFALFGDPNQFAGRVGGKFLVGFFRFDLAKRVVHADGTAVRFEPFGKGDTGNGFAKIRDFEFYNRHNGRAMKIVNVNRLTDARHRPRH